MRYTHVAVMQVDGSGRIAKRADFASKAEADAHVEKFRDKFPDAFVTPILETPESHWMIDAAKKKITVVPPPPTPPEPEPMDFRAEINALKGRLTATENSARTPR